MPDLVSFLLSAFAYCPVRFVVYALPFADDVPDLSAGALVACFAKLGIVRIVVAEGRFS